MKCSVNGDWSCDNDNCEFYMNHDLKKCAMPAHLDKFSAMNFVHKGKELEKLICAGIPAKSPIRYHFKGKIIKTVHTNIISNGKPMVEYKHECPFKMAFTLEKAKKNLEELGFPNFTFDRASGLVFVDFQCGRHDIFMSALYVLNKIKNGTANERQKDGSVLSSRESFSLSDYASAYVTEGFGFFSSSVNMGFGAPRERGFPIICSEDHKLNAQEKAIFKPYGFRPMKEREEN